MLHFSIRVHPAISRNRSLKYQFAANQAVNTKKQEPIKTWEVLVDTLSTFAHALMTGTPISDVIRACPDNSHAVRQRRDRSGLRRQDTGNFKIITREALASVEQA